MWRYLSGLLVVSGMASGECVFAQAPAGIPEDTQMLRREYWYDKTFGDYDAYWDNYWTWYDRELVPNYGRGVGRGGTWGYGPMIGDRGWDNDIMNEGYAGRSRYDTMYRRRGEQWVAPRGGGYGVAPNDASRWPTGYRDYFDRYYLPGYQTPSYYYPSSGAVGRPEVSPWY